MSIWKFAGSAAFVFASFLVAFMTAPSSSEAEQTIRFIDEQEGRILAKLDRYGIPGVAISLIKDGDVVWTQGYGLADRDTDLPMTSSTRVESGSIAKSLTAWGVMRLVEQDRITLDTPVEKYLNNWQFPESTRDTTGITVEGLLSNSSGMPFSIDIPSIQGIRQGNARTEDVIPAQDPDEAFIYSNPGWVLLAMMIEDVSGQSYPDFMREEVLEPLGMHNSGFGWHDEFDGEAATGYTFAGEPVPADTHGPYGAGGLYSTAEDLALFVRASLGTLAEESFGSGLLNPETVKVMHTPRIDIDGGYHGLMSESYGLGHFVETLPNGQTGVTHGGESEGWLTAYYLVPENGDGLVILSNSRRSWPIVRVLDDWANWQGLPSTVMTRSYQRLELAVYTAVGVFSTASVVWLGLLIYGLKTGRRRIALTATDRWPGRIIQLALGVALLAGWWMIARELAGPFFPVFVDFLSAAITAYSVTLILLAFTILVRLDEASQQSRIYHERS